MSTSGRYQSRVLSFFSQQSLRLRDQAGQAVRQLKLAAVLGAQIVLYPLYVAFQTGRLLDRQLQQAAQRIFPQLQSTRQKNQPLAAIAIDTPIQNTLQAIQNLHLLLPASQVIEPLAGTIDSPATNALALTAHHDHIHIAIVGLPSAIASSPPHSVTHSAAITPTTSATVPASELASASINPSANTLLVQGVASMLTTHHLVLVTPSNEVLDILTPEQRSQLQKYIVWEVASYWRQQRQLGITPSAELVTTSRSTTFLPLPKIRPTQLPPIRIFRQLMTWMQISPIAIATNLFQESQLVPLLEAGTLPLDQLPTRLLPVGYPSNANSSTLQAEWRSSTMQHLWQSLTTEIPSSFPPKNLPNFTLRSLPTAQPSLLQWLQTKTQQFKQLPEKLATDILEKTGLIYSPRSLPTEFITPPSDLDRPNPDSSDWLTMEELFGDIPIQVRQPSVRQPSVRQASAIDRVSSRTTTQPPHQTLTTATPTATPTATLSVVEPPADSASPTFTPSWIEAEVKLVKYEKHPLEQLLQWLDNSMVWLETKFSQAWQWIRDRF